MVARAIPSTGEAVPVVGLGTWKTFDVSPRDYDSRAAVLDRFVERGGRLVDSSPMYGRAEAVLGELTAKRKIRPSLFVATKVWTEGERAGVAQMTESSAKLQTDIIDLLQVHNLVDAGVHLRTLADWKAAGKVRYIGVTHYTVASHAALERYVRAGGIDFVQLNYSLAVRDAERRLLPAAQAEGVATLINRPFESGDLFGRVRGTPLPDWAAAIGCTSWAQIFLKYVVSHPAVTCAIPATSNVSHLDELLAAGHEPLPDEALRRRMASDWDRLSR